MEIGVSLTAHNGEMADNPFGMPCATMDMAASVNVANHLDEFARTMPHSIAVAQPTRRVRQGRRVYRTVTFAELAGDVAAIAAGLAAWGIRPGTRLALLVPPGVDFIALVFALLKSGAVQILIDPGMGKRNLATCLAEAEPEGFITLPALQLLRRILGHRFGKARWNVTVGRSLWPTEMTLAGIRRRGACAPGTLPTTKADDAAAIIFTSGGTGTPKGVLYRHGNFDRQVIEIRDRYGIRPGEVDLPCFALFGLFNAAMGVTTVLPRMDFSRPATVEPRNIVEAVEQWNATQSFASPAVWNLVGPYCRDRGIGLRSLKRVLSAGAPVPARVISPMRAVLANDAEFHVSYGATEALPVATIEAAEVLTETWPRTIDGQGVCVGRRFREIEWRVIRIVDGPIGTIQETQEMPPQEIGELIVRGPVVTTQYVTRREANSLAKINDSSSQYTWHRMGDCGYLDHSDRFWFCGRVAHRVLTRQGPLYTIPCEAIFNQHPDVFRTALVGIGPHGAQTPVIVAEPKRTTNPRRGAKIRLLRELTDLAQAHRLTKSIRDFLIRRAMPVDVRHNAKIAREKLAIWAAKRLKRRLISNP